MTHGTSLADLPATELLRLYRDRSASPVEVVKDCIARIAELDPLLNAFCRFAPEEAMAAARESEARWMRGEAAGELDGIPVSVKDLILAKGWPTRRGSRTVDPLQAWDEDAPATARLRECGAVILGKTTTPEFGCKAETVSPLTGVTRNPWDPRLSPGGSSGGSAVAVATGMGPLSIGTDGGGSIRVPSSFCGVFGLKPSFGRVPAYPASPFGSVSHIGPHAMTVADAALAMNVLKRPDARDWSSLPPDASDLRATLRDGVRGLRIAYSPTLGFARVDARIADAVDRAAAQLESLGAHVEKVDPGFEDPADILAGLWSSGAWKVWDGLDEEQRAVVDPDFRDVALLGSRVTALDLHTLQLRRAALGMRMRRFMCEWDLLVTPTVSVAAFAAERAPGQSFDLYAMLARSPFTYPFNLTQQPACSIPCGSVDGLPVGLQIVGPMFADDLVLRAAHAYEQSRPIARPPLGRFAQAEATHRD
jgi:aspartyl-tRNA(Asn)/glutamyl-tRNA(Gln) amidotransferase subunit A